MILIDTAIWIDHLHHSEPEVARLLDQDMVMCHPMVIGELALGSIKNRDEILALLRSQQRLRTIGSDEFLEFVHSHRLMSRGLSYVDVHLLGSTLITPGVRFWTRDRRLKKVAEELGAAWEPSP